MRMTAFFYLIYNDMKLSFNFVILETDKTERICKSIQPL